MKLVLQIAAGIIVAVVVVVNARAVSDALSSHDSQSAEDRDHLATHAPSWETPDILAAEALKRDYASTRPYARLDYSNPSPAAAFRLGQELCRDESLGDLTPESFAQAVLPDKAIGPPHNDGYHRGSAAARRKFAQGCRAAQG